MKEYDDIEDEEIEDEESKITKCFEKMQTHCIGLQGLNWPT